MIPDEILQEQNPWWRDGAIRRARGYPVRRDLQLRVLRQVLRLDDRRATVLLGPHQVGKTVLLLQLVDDLLDRGLPPGNLTYFDFADDRLPKPIAAREVVEYEPVGLDPDHPRVFLFDQIRSAPRWDLWLKQAVDTGVGRIVAADLAASQSWGGALESGLGRWDELSVESMSFREFAKFHALPGEAVEEVVRRVPNLHERYMVLGGFPEHALNDDYPEVRRQLRGDIAERAILSDLAGTVSDVPRVLDLFVYLVQDSGADFNAEARSRDLGADPRTVRDWVRLLTETLLIAPMERHARQPSAGLRSKSKIYAADPGLVMAFALSPVQDPAVRGRAFEAAVFRHLREAARELEGRLTYYRKDDDLEIDFVLESAESLIGIEVKGSSRIRPEKVERLRKAGEALGADRLLLVHGGLLDEKQEGVEPVALARFLADPSGFLKGEGHGG